MIGDLVHLALAAVLGGCAIHYILALASFVAADCFDRSSAESADRWSR